MNIKSPSGLSVEFLENGSIKSIQADPIRISLKAASSFSKPWANIYLRKRSATIEFMPLTGPESQSRFAISENRYLVEGQWYGLDYRCTLRLSESSLSWQWDVELKCTADEFLEFDLVYVQDIGLKPLNAGLINEYYVSQYLERRILEDRKYGPVICCRQNMRESTGHPWLMMACKNGAIAGSVDGMQFFGRTFRQTGIPEGLAADRLAGEYAGESSYIALQEQPFRLGPGESWHSAFVATYFPDHSEATSEADLGMLPGLMNEFITGTPSLVTGTPSLVTGTPSLVSNLSFLPVDDLTDEELSRFFGQERRFPETADDRLLSFFSHDRNHVVLRQKEVLTDRPHGHIMQTGTGVVPDEAIMSTTSFMFGVFNSHLTQGNTNFNTLLSVCTSQFNQSPETGQRIILTIDNRQFLLGVPSAFEMGLNHCRWIYKYGRHIFQLRTWTSLQSPQVNLDFKVLRGEPVNLVITHHFDPLNGWEIKPGKAICESMATPNPDSMIVAKFPNVRFRIIVQDEKGDFGTESLWRGMESPGKGMESLGKGTESLFIIRVNETDNFCMSFIGEVVSPIKENKIANADAQFQSDCMEARTAWQDFSMNLSLQSDQPDIAAIHETLPWYGMNALIHFLTPYGLEQFGGAAWGTRDVSQGPVELLLTLGKYEAARHVLKIIFSNQNPDGGWPQWWMFDSYHNIRAHEAHGDIFYWCIIALSNYIKVTGDLGILEETLPYYHEKGTEQAEITTLLEHIERLVSMITDSFIPDKALVPFGGGDWNDSLQPVSRELAQRMISSWTVEMNYQSFQELRQVFERSGYNEKAEKLSMICIDIQRDFNRYLVKDGVVAGYGLAEPDGSISVILHPSDTTTGIKYSLLPMERGILSGIFTREQALHHQDLIKQYLKGPDGARLMDRPMQYKGGIQSIFQRAESSIFFGREIGLMYVHEHIRYAESLAITGKAEDFVKALRQAIPVGYRDIVPCGDIRQANCYYSSSDVHFKNRYEADERYDEIRTGNITLRGGWRVYSSGPGIFISLVASRLLGFRVENGNIILDPVMPFSLDGLSARWNFNGHSVTFRYSIKERNFSPNMIRINGQPVDFNLEINQYRQGGAVIPKGKFLAMLKSGENVAEIVL